MPENQGTSIFQKITGVFSKKKKQEPEKITKLLTQNTNDEAMSKAEYSAYRKRMMKKPETALELKSYKEWMKARNKQVGE